MNDLNSDNQVNFSDLNLFGVCAGTGGWSKYAWDAENRLVAVEPGAPGAGSKKVEYKYDYRNRRIERAVYAWDDVGGDWETTATEIRRWVYNGWLPAVEFDVNTNGDLNDPVRKYT